MFKHWLNYLSDFWRSFFAPRVVWSKDDHDSAEVRKTMHEDVVRLCEFFHLAINRTKVGYPLWVADQSQRAPSRSKIVDQLSRIERMALREQRRRALFQLMWMHGDITKEMSTRLQQQRPLEARRLGQWLTDCAF